MFWKQLSQRKSLKRNITTFLVSSFHECHLFENNFYFLFLSPFISVYFLSFRGQKIKNITKNEQKRLLLFPFLVSFIMAFLAQKLIHAINIWINFVFGSFFEHDHLFNLIILEVYAKRWPKCARISKPKPMQPKIWSMNFFLTLTVRRPIYFIQCLWLRIIRRFEAAITKKNYLRLLPFYMAVAIYFYYEKVRRTMRIAIVSYLLKSV